MLHRFIDAWHVLTGQAKAVPNRPQFIADRNFYANNTTGWIATGWDIDGNGLSATR